MRSSNVFLSSMVAAMVARASPALASIGRGVPKDLYLRARADGSYQDLYNRNGPSPNNRLVPPKMQKRNQAGRARQATATNALGLSYPTDEAGFAKVTDDKVLCNYYYLPEVAAIQNNYPTPWLNGATTGATLLPNDTEGLQVWNSIKSQVPTNIAVKPISYAKDPLGDLIFTGYDTQTDPDCWWSDTNCHSPKLSGLPEDVYMCPEPDTWGLTFDDGPNCTHNAWMDFLKTNNQKANLYYIGSNVLDWPLQAQRGLADGHSICIHTWSHRPMTTLQSENVFAELWYTAKIIKDIVGITPRCWRPPYGDVDDRVRAIANAMGLATHIWTDDTNDFDIAPGGPSPTAVIQQNYQKIIATGLAKPSSGIIVLTHELTDGTMDLFQEEYANITKAFKHVVPLTACLNESNPYEPDSGISYPDFNTYIAGNVMPSGLPSSFNIKTHDYNPVSISSAAAAASATSTSTATDSSVWSMPSSAAKGSSSADKNNNKKGGAAPASLGSGPAVLAGMAASMALGAAVVLL
ncbi:hypothetical protein OC842_003458 [Tilletia horrida]|uniref:chitin deacetylase n=1 Tax=Tilletia horrida TaxID=155126 RepID=A0AAN6JK57_9BASI|nr:hypothetical protein OC842_003458 [Tilletia horrida]